MIEFKQIIGRGTRIHEESGKRWFTIMDFKKATELFADPDWDGDPEVIFEGPEPPREPKEKTGEGNLPGPVKYRVSGVEVGVLGSVVNTSIQLVAFDN